MARRLVRWYGLMWGIECWHKVLKEVCQVERRQLKTAQGLQRALTLDMIVASRALLMSRLGKEHPDFPAELIYSPGELEVLQEIRQEEIENRVEREVAKEVAKEITNEIAKELTKEE